MSISKRLKAARHALTATQDAMAVKSGIPVGTYQKYELGQRAPGAKAIQGLMQLGINANWLLTGEGPMLLADLARPGEVIANRVHAPIPRYTVEKKGVEQDIPSEIARIDFYEDWLARRGIRPVDLIYIRMPDDSMTPTISPGSFLVVDCSSDKFRGDGIYMLQSDSGLAVKRFQNDFNGGLYIMSDNTSYQKQHVLKDDMPKLYIIGKVIWAGGEI